MATNIFKNSANGLVCKKTVAAVDIFDIGDIVIAYEIGTNRTFVPGRPINSFTSFVAEKSYYIVGSNQDLDREEFFIPRINTPPTGQYRLVTQEDIDLYPQMQFGDYIIDGPNAGQGVIDYPPQLGPCANIYIKGGVYEYIFLDLINTQGSSACPITITNYDGQVDANKMEIFGADFILTGEYNPTNRTGDPAYTGWDKLDTDGHMMGAFGFNLGQGYLEFLSTSLQCNQSRSQVGTRPSISNITIHNVEMGEGGYAGVAFKTDDYDTLNMDNITIRDCYIHDTGGEGVYVGSTGTDPQHQFNSFRLYNNLIVRSALNGIQLGQMANDCRIYNNTVIAPAMDWAQAFGVYQDFSTQFQTRKGGLSVYNNLIVGGGENFVTFYMRAKTGLTQDNSVVLFQNNAFVHLKNSYAVYINLFLINPVNIKFDNNIFGKFNRSEYEKVFPGQFTTNYNFLLDSQLSQGTIEITNNIVDNSNPKGPSFIKFNPGVANINIVDTGNTIAEVPEPEFGNFMDLPTGFNYSKFENWTNVIGINYPTNYTNAGQVRSYDEDDYVFYRGRLYRSLHDNNAGNQPQGVTDSHWQVILFSTGNTTNIPDDARLVEGSYYAQRGIGMLRYASSSTTPSSTSTTSSSSTTTSSTSTSSTTTTTIPPSFSSDDIMASVEDNGNNTFTLKWAVNRSQLTTQSNFRVVGIGSSTLAGTGATSAATSLQGRVQEWLTANTNGGKMTPLALGGSDSRLFLPEGTPNINPTLNVDAAISTKPSCAFISLPSNDAVNGLTPQQTVDNFLTIYNRFRNFGIPCFVITPQPRNSATSGQQTVLKDTAALIRTTFPTEFVVDVFDLLRDTGAGTDAVINPIYHSGDGIHLNNAGHQLVANELIAKIDDYFQDPAYIEYEVERSTSPTTGFTLFDTVTGSANVSKIYNRVGSTLYYYRVRAQKIDTTFTNYTNTVSLAQPFEAGALDQEVRIAFSNASDAAPPSDWNNWIGATSGDTVVGTSFSNFENITDVATGISATVTKRFGPVLSGAGATSGIYPANVSRTGWTSRLTFNDYSQIRFSGLSNQNVYKVEVLTSYGNAANPCLSVRNNDNWFIRDFQNSSDYPTSTSGNSTRLIELKGLIPNANGELTLDFFPLVYLGGVVSGLVIKRYANPNPSTTSSTTTSSTSTTSTTSTTTLPPSTTTTTTVLGTQGTINVNLFGGVNPYNDNAWNNWNIGTTSAPLGFTNLKYDNGASSNINLAWATGGTSNQIFDGLSDNGGSYVGSATWPSQVLRYAAFTFGVGLTASNTDEFIISGLDNGSTYTIQLIGSRSGGDRLTYYRCIGATDTTSASINSNNNSTSFVEFTNISPLAGQIRIRFATVTGTATTGYLNAFKIIVNGGAPTTTTTSTSTTTTSSSTTTTTTSGGPTTTTTSTTTTTTLPAGVGNVYTENVIVSQFGGTRQAYVRTPADYNSTSTEYPLLIFLHGAGEAVNGGSSGTGIAKLYQNANRGPAYFIQQGVPFDFTNPITGLVEKFIVVCPQNTSWSISSSQLDYILEDILNRYRVNTDKIYLTGLSAGGMGIVDYMINSDNGNAFTPTYVPAAAVPMSAAIGTPTNQQGLTIANKNIKLWGIGSFSDIHGQQTFNLINRVNDNSNPDLGRWTEYSGGHCCWGQFYNPTYRENIAKADGTGTASMNIYEWMLQFDNNTNITTSTTTTTSTSSTSTTSTSSTSSTSTTSTSSTSTTSTTTLAPSGDVIQVNLYNAANANVGIYSNSQWNNWSITLSGANNYAYSPTFNYTNGSPSSVQARWSTTAVTACVVNYSDNNFGWPSSGNTTGFPSETFRISPYTQTNDTRLRIIGLPTDTVNGYRLEILCTRNTTTSRPVTFTVGAATDTVEAANNLTDVVVLDNLTPSGGVIEVDIDYGNGFAYINAFRIIRK